MFQKMLLRNIDHIVDTLDSPKSPISLEEVGRCVSEIRNKFKSFDEMLKSEEGFQEFMRTVEIAPEARTIGRFLNKNSVVETVRQMVEEKIDNATFCSAFVAASQERKKEISKEERSGSFSERNRTLKGFEHLRDDHFLNYLRLVGILPPEEGVWHEYKLAREKSPTPFANQVIAYRNGPKGNESIISGKNILTFGPGSGRDEAAFVRAKANRVSMVEKSPIMLSKLRSTRDNLSWRVKKPFVLPENTSDILTALRKMVRNGEQVDTIYSHSTLHYFDDKTFKKIVSLVKKCLKPNGHFAFAIKAPNNTIFDGQGIPISIEDQELVDEKRSNESSVFRIYKHAWLNADGQIRYFRDARKIIQTVKQKDDLDRDDKKFLFSIKSSTDFWLQDYETEGEGDQKFFYFIFKKVKSEEPELRNSVFI